MGISGIENTRRLAASARAAGPKAAAHARQAVLKTALDMQAIAQAAAPVDTGFLRSSIGVDRSGSGSFARAVVGPAAAYGAFLEFGTYKMAPRPYLMPAADAVEPAFIAAMQQINTIFP